MRSIAAPLLLLVATGAMAQHPLGEEFQVDTYTPSFQIDPAVSPDEVLGASLSSGRASGSSGNDDSSSSIQAQRFDANGAEIGAEFQVNTYTTDGQGRPAVSPDGSGGFIVAWDSDGSNGNDNSDRSVQAQRFDAVGDPVGTEFQVNT